MTDSAAGNYHPTEEDGTCGQYLGTGFIPGGEYTKRGELPYQAALGYKDKRGNIKYNCGGTLINRYICSIDKRVYVPKKKKIYTLSLNFLGDMSSQLHNVSIKELQGFKLQK